MTGNTTIDQRFKGILMFFIIQPFLTLSNSSTFQNTISLILVIIMSLIWWLLAFGLYKRKHWSRICGAILCFIQVAASIYAVIVLPFYFQPQGTGEDIIRGIFWVTEGLVILLGAAYCYAGWWLLRKKTKEYFDSYKPISKT